MANLNPQETVEQRRLAITPLLDHCPVLLRVSLQQAEPDQRTNHTRKQIEAAIRQGADTPRPYCVNALDGLADPAAFARRLRQLRQVEWVVYAKPPFGGPAQVLAYLGRYTHRVAIANSRLVSLTDSTVSFRWKDYRHHGKAKLVPLEAHEFIRRFLLHTLPDGFHRIRHYGFLANGHRAAKLALCRKLLATPPPEPTVEPAEDAPLAHRYDRCPCCGGAMTILATLQRQQPCRPSFWPSFWDDTS
jgi:hypothetical protein